LTPDHAARPALEVAAIVRAHGAAFLQTHGASLSAAQRQVLRDLAACRTAALGGHLERCGACGHERPHYNSCRNRHCPKCQGGARAAWLARAADDLLPVEYYHVVFTLPHELGPLALQNPAVVYNLLLRSAAATLLAVAADPKHLGAQVGVLAALHTWGQTLTHHAHVHCLVSGGGLSCNAAGDVDAVPRWLSCRPGFCLPVRVLGRVFRGKFLAGLRAAQAAGELACHGRLAELADAGRLAAWLRPLYQTDWVVYVQPPAAGPAGVLKYLARYVRRVALSNSRLLELADEAVTFRYKDYAHGGKARRLTLPVTEFLRRFVQHVLPRGFVAVRPYGLLGSRGRAAKLALCRRLLAPLVLTAALADIAEAVPAEPAATAACPVCGSSCWRVVAVLPRPAARPDSS
jgi:hypothetical protein